MARRVSEKTRKTKKTPSLVSKKPRKTKKTPDPVSESEVLELSDDVLDPGVEYSFKVDLSFSVDFEGDVMDVSENRIRRKLKAEILAAMKGASLIAANDFGLRAGNIRVSPITISSAINDQMSIDEQGDGNV